MVIHLTATQARIVMSAKSYFYDTLARSEIRSMFRQEGLDMSVGLALSVAGHHFIVRRTISWGVCDECLNAMLSELLVELDASHMSVLGRPVEIQK